MTLIEKTRLDREDFTEDRIQAELRRTGTETKEFRGAKMPIYRYSLLIKHLDKETKESFQFHGSINGFKKDRHPSIFEVIDCVISDALSYWDYEDIDEFHKAFGYESIKETQKAYEGCKKTAKHFEEKFGFDREKAGELLNKIREEL